MVNPPRPATDGPDIDLPADSAASSRNASGLWSLEGDRLTSVEDFEEGPAIVLIRSEHVLITPVRLPPIPSAARRRAALPFAIEERIAEPLGEVHVAMGRQVAPDTWLVGVVRHDLMREWLARLEQAGLGHAALVPDALALPVPGEGSWAVDLAAGRALVRTPDAAGFALPAGMLERSWQAAGGPACMAYGDPLPPAIGGASAGLQEQPLASRLLDPALDLRDGIYAVPRRPVNSLWKRAAIVAALGAAAHAGIALADTIALSSIADRREAELRDLAGTAQPGFEIGPDLGTSADRFAPSGPVSPPGRFLPLLSQTSSALVTMPAGVSWQALRYDANGVTLSLDFGTVDSETLQAARDALTGSGLVVGDGDGEAVLTVTAP